MFCISLSSHTPFSCLARILSGFSPNSKHLCLNLQELLLPENMIIEIFQFQNSIETMFRIRVTKGFLSGRRLHLNFCYTIHPGFSTKWLVQDNVTPTTPLKDSQRDETETEPLSSMIRKLAIFTDM